MLAVALFGLLLCAISVLMIARPAAWARSIVAFVHWRYVHPFEVASRLGFGVLFVLFAEQTRFPGLIRAIGYVLIAVGVGLVFLPPSTHRRFGVWCAERFERWLRPAGLMSLAAGLFLIWAAFPGG